MIQSLPHIIALEEAATPASTGSDTSHSLCGNILAGRPRSLHQHQRFPWVCGVDGVHRPVERQRSQGKKVTADVGLH